MAISTWNILTCPHCGKLAKLPKEIGNSKALCPHCKSPLPSADDLPAKRNESTSIPEALVSPMPTELPIAPPPDPAEPATPITSSIPTNRSFNPDAMHLRTDREGWERKAPELREIDFKERLARTTDPAMVQGPNDPPPLKRKRLSRSELRHRNLGWETEQRANSTSWSAWRRALRKLPWGLIGVVIVLLGLVSWKIMSIRRQGTLSINQNPISDAPQAPSLKPKQSELELRPKSAILTDLTPVLKAFVDAQSSTAMKPLVREPDRVHPLMDLYYQEQEPFNPVDYNTLPRYDNLFVHKNFVVASLETKEFESFTISLEKGPQGYLVDWESFVAYGDMPLSRFQKLKPTTPTLFRFIIEPASYPNLDFPSSETHQAYKLYTKNRAQMIYGYVPRQSPPHEKMMSALISKQSIFCVLRIKYPTHSTNDNQVEISHYLQTGWVLRGEDYEAPVSNDPAHGVLGD